MKRLLFITAFFLTLVISTDTKAQDFTMTHDTVTFTTVSTQVNDFLINNAADSIRIQWHVIASDFPADWMTSTALGMCDNRICYGNTGSALWNGTTGSTQTTKYPTGSANFDYAPGLSAASPGTHYITVQFTDPSGSRNATFIITRPVVSGVNQLNNTVTDALIYPNPASNELNVVYDADADIKSIAVYNLIGKTMNVYKTTASTSANLDLSNLPSGIYFARLINGHGQVVVTKKFTKQ